MKSHIQSGFPADINSGVPAITCGIYFKLTFSEALDFYLGRYSPDFSDVALNQTQLMRISIASPDTVFTLDQPSVISSEPAGAGTVFANLQSSNAIPSGISYSTLFGITGSTDIYLQLEGTDLEAQEVIVLIENLSATPWS